MWSARLTKIWWFSFTFSDVEDSTEIWTLRASEPALSCLVEVFVFFCVVVDSRSVRVILLPFL